MADISTVTASAAISQPVPALASVQAAVVSLSGDLQALQRGVQINAVPVAPPVNGQLVLQTALGTVTLALPALTSVGDAAQQALLGKLWGQLATLAQTQRPLTLVLQPGTTAGAPTTQAVLVIPLGAQGTSGAATSGEPPVTTAVQTVTPPSLPASSVGGTAGLPPVTPGAVLTAIILPPDHAPVLPLTVMTGGAAATTPPQTSDMPPSPASSPVAVAAQTSPASSAPVLSEPVSSVAASSVPVSSLPTAPAPGATTAIAPAPVPAPSQLVAGQEIRLQIDAVIPPDRPVPPLAAGQIAATVQSGSQPGQLMLKTGDTTIFARVSGPATTGSTLVLTVKPSAPAFSLPVTLAAPTAAALPSLGSTLAALAQIAPALQQQAFARLPQANEILPHALVLLFGAFRSGDAPQWLGAGPADALLNAGKTALVTALSQELADSGQTAHDDVVGAWQTYPIPFYMAGAPQQVSLYVRHDTTRDGNDGESAGAASPAATRFLIEMKLTRLGDMQIDGFVRPKTLDMVLRSAAHLPPGLHEELRAAYIDAIGAVGYAGSLNFQTGRGNWLVIRTAAQQSAVI